MKNLVPWDSQQNERPIAVSVFGGTNISYYLHIAQDVRGTVLSILTHSFISSSWQANHLHVTDEETGTEKWSNFPKVWLQSLFS